EEAMTPVTIVSRVVGQAWRGDRYQCRKEGRMLRRRLAAMAVSLALVAGLSAAPAHAASPLAPKGNHGNPCKHHRCDVPEAPLPIGLPLVGLGVLGGYV